MNNLNDGMAWGLLPIVFASAQMTIEQIGILAAIYPATWGVAQLGTGGLSDRLGRKWLIVSGMWVQAAGLVLVGATSTFPGFAVGGVFMGVGTAMVYPTLLAAIADVAAPSWRGSALGRVPVLARFRIRRGCGDRGGGSRSVRLHQCDLARRLSDLPLRRCRLNAND